MAMHSPLPAVATVMVMVLGGLLIPSALASPQTHSSIQSPSISSDVFQSIGNALPPVGARLLGPISTTQNLEVSLTLASRDPSGLASVTSKELAAKGSGLIQPLSSSEYSTYYSPDPTQVRALVSYLNSDGLTTSQLGSMLTVSGPAVAIERAFGVQLNMYRYAGITAWAPAAPIQLPAGLAATVSGETGFNTFVKPVTNLMSPIGKGPIVVPHAGTISVSLTPPYFNMVYSGTTYITPPAGMNLTYVATATLPTGDTCAPCTFKWSFVNPLLINIVDNTTSATDTVHYTYTEPANQFTNPMQISVNVTDTQKNTGSAADAVIPTMSPTWMQQVYGESALFAKGFEGQGMTIGLDEMCDPSFDSGTANYNAAVDNFSTAMSLPAPNIKYVGPGTTCASTSGVAGWSEETVLDMDWAHAMAPDATEEVYFGASSQGVDIAGGDSIWANASSGVFVASNSWGLNEEYAQISGVGGSGPYDSYWNQAASQGVSLFSSSGDCGGTANSSTVEPSSGVNVSYPSSIPTGIGVGGTIVTTTSSGNWSGEYVWNSTAYTPGQACNNGWGTGGGWSRFYSTPGYQQNMSGAGWAPPAPPKWPLSGPRGIPDVAMDAATWVDIEYPGYGWMPTGGTSLASPMFASLMSVVLQAMNRGYQNTPPGFLNVPIYAIGKSPAYGSSFHDITLGNNRDPQGYSATTGWDPCTGWGSPDAVNLLGGMRTVLPLKYNISGFVLNRSTGLGIPGVNITASQGAGTAVTAANGSYSVFLPNGTYTLTASKTGFNPNTLGIAVNGSAMVDQNITLAWIAQYGLAMQVSGTMVSETHMALQGGIIRVSGSGLSASAASGPGGHFTLYLANGSYSLTAYYTVAYPSINPAYNVTTMTFTVSGPTNLLVTMYFTRDTLTGYVLDRATTVPLAGATVSGFDLVSSNATTASNGEFHLHLPTGTATINAALSTYLPTTATVFVDWRNTSAITIDLTKSQAVNTQILLSLRVAAPLNATGGIPTVVGNSSTTVDLWTNNSTTGAPQGGVSILLVDTLGGSFSHQSLLIPSSGAATVTFKAPYITRTTLDDIVASVTTPGLVGTNSTDIWVTTSTSVCRTSCAYPISGTILAASGARLSGVTITILSSLGSQLAQVTSGTGGSFHFYEQNGSYEIEASLSGYQSTKQPFSVRGGPESLGSIILQPNPTSIGTGKFLFNPYMGVAFVAAAAILVVGVLFLMRRLHRLPPPEKGEEHAPAPAAPIDAEAEIFPPSPETPVAPLPPAPPTPDSSPPGLPPAAPGVPEEPKSA